MSDVDIRFLRGKWIDGDAFIVGTGTSLRGFDYSLIKGRFTVALNCAVKQFSPSVLIFSDDQLWRRYVGLPLKNTAVVCQSGAVHYLKKDKRCAFSNQVFLFRRTTRPPVRLSDDMLHVGRTVACGALYLCWKLGVRRVFMLGVDGYRTSEAYYSDGSMHQKGDRQITKRTGSLLQEDRHLRWSSTLEEAKGFFKSVKAYPSVWPGPGIYNLNPKSLVGSWPKIDIGEALKSSLSDFEPANNGGVEWFKNSRVRTDAPSI